MGSWVNWKGGDCPVNHESVVEVQLKDGRIMTCEVAGWLCWHHRHGVVSSSIVKYRVISEPTNTLSPYKN